MKTSGLTPHDHHAPEPAPEAPLDVLLLRHNLRIQTPDVTLTEDQLAAVMAVAESHGWNRLSDRSLGLMLWAMFRYYVMRTPV